ncbi:hypothetical protein BGX34_008662 [Mortierella sp. NVP85]|nr:hypothetical protein BGX34_008662 [Mortierella sp. NVP85]
MTNFLSYTQLVTSRDEAQLRKQATMTFGPQGVADLAVLGAILGNHIREIGRYKVTCDGQLVQGRYTIYELAHSGALHVTGRRESRKTHPSRVGGSSNDNNSVDNKDGSHRIQRIYPSTLANIFPALVFKTLRKKSIRPPKFQHRDEDQGDNNDIINDDDGHDHDNLTFLTTPSLTTTTSSDPMLITSETVLSSLVQQKLHRVKDLPLPQELCFLGAVSLPLPRVLRAMHVAWTMDFLNIRATTTRRQRRQLKTLSTTMNTTPAMPTGGLEFRPDIYAHKMRVARLARAHHKTTASRSMTSSSAGADDMSIRRHTSIPEEYEEDGEGLDTASTVQQPMASTPTNSTSHPRSIHRKEKRLIQHLLSLENKAPRTVRQWATAARSCFAEELIQEDRQVQEWVEHQRAQVVLGYGGHSTPATMATHGPIGRNNTSGSLFARRRPCLSPISTTLANSIHYNATGLNKSPLSAKVQTAPKAVPRVRETAAIPIPASQPSTRQSLLSTARSSLPEGGAARLGTSPRAVWGRGGKLSAQALFDQTLAIALPSPISATQMLSMHLYLTLLVSPLSPEYMLQDFGRMDS